jgi:geranylgeranyl pyrophosphate synthase
MNTTTQGWLSDDSVRLLLSEQLKATGHLMLQEVRDMCLPPGFGRLLMESLRAQGKLLGRPVMQGQMLDTSDTRAWSLLAILFAASAAHADTTSLGKLPMVFWQRACATAAAVEFLTTAIDIIDDIQDGDSLFVQRIGVPMALNIGVVLHELAPLALSRARPADWPEAIADKALGILHKRTIGVMIGQYMDLRLEHVRSATEAQVMKMTGQKSGTLVSLVCQLGALAGITHEHQYQAEYLDAVSLLGWHLGIWAQLLNDLYDAEHGLSSTRKSDRQRGKKTLPLLLEQQGMIEEANESKEYQNLSTQAAFAYTYVAAEASRLRAQQALENLEKRFGLHTLLWPLVAW